MSGHEIQNNLLLQVKLTVEARTHDKYLLEGASAHRAARSALEQLPEATRTASEESSHSTVSSEQRMSKLNQFAAASSSESLGRRWCHSSLPRLHLSGARQGQTPQARHSQQQTTCDKAECCHKYNDQFTRGAILGKRTENTATWQQLVTNMSDSPHSQKQGNRL